MGVFSIENYQISESSDIINEAYYGYYTGMNDLVEQLSIVRSKYIGLSKFSVSIDKLNTDKELYKFCDMVADFFGFASFNLTIDPNAVISAYTVSPAFRSIKMTKNLITKDKNGIRYKEGSGVSCYVFTSEELFLNKDFTDREVMAVIVHEIGHNFSSGVDFMLTTSEVLKKIYGIPISIMSLLSALLKIGNPSQLIMGKNSIDRDLRAAGLTSFISEKIYKSITKSLSNIEGVNTLNRLLSVPSNVQNMAIDIAGPLLLPLIAVQTLYKFIEQGILGMLDSMITRTYIGKKDERLSDAFATMYGLGEDLATALHRLDSYGVSGTKVGKNIRKVPLIGWTYDLLVVPCNMIFALTDVHPEVANRAYEQIKYLRNELNNMDLNPRVRKELEQNLRDIENTVKEQYNEVSVYRGTLVADIYNKIIYNICIGKDKANIKLILPNTDTKSLNSAYDNVKMI